MGRYAEAQGLLEDSLSIARMVGNDERITMALHSLGEQFYAQGMPAEARKYIEEALPLARRLEHKIPLVAVLAGLAGLNRLERKLDAAEALYRESLPVARDLGDFSDIVVGLINLACISIARGSRDPPGEMLLEALEYAERMGSKALGASVLHISAGLAASTGEWRRAAQLRGAATAQCEQIGFHVDPLDEEFLVPLIAKAREALGPETFAASEAAGRSLSYGAALAEVRACLGEAGTTSTEDCTEPARSEPAQ
jgi:tetratricopeptide (TPR) repeat protein